MSKDSKSLRICKYFFGRRRAAEAKNPQRLRHAAPVGLRHRPRAARLPAEQPDRKREGPREEGKSRAEQDGLCKAERTSRSRNERAKREEPRGAGKGVQSGKSRAERNGLCKAGSSVRNGTPARRDKTEERYPHPAGTAPLQCRDTRSPPREPDVRRGLPSVRRTSPDGGRLNASSPVRGRS